MTSIAIVGSRGFTDANLIHRALARWLDLAGGDTSAIRVVSGGAVGADSIGERTARALGIRTLVHLPDWERLGKSAGFVRNNLIVRDADVVLAFFAPGPKSRGTAHTVAAAKIAGLEVFEYHEGAWAHTLARGEEARTDARGVLDPA